MHTPSPDSAADSMTCLNQGCEVGHSGVTTWADNASTYLITPESISALWNRFWMLGSRAAPPQWITWPIQQSLPSLSPVCKTHLVNSSGQCPLGDKRPMPSNWIPGLSAPKPPASELKKRPTVEGVSEEDKNEKVISLEELEQDKESGSEVPNDGRALSF